MRVNLLLLSTILSLFRTHTMNLSERVEKLEKDEKYILERMDKIIDVLEDIAASPKLKKTHYRADEYVGG